MAVLNIKGDIVTNEYRRFYEYFEWECACPSMVTEAINARENGETLDVYINSGGGLVSAGQEIYSLLRAADNVRIHIDGQACSAASIIACAGYCEITPVGLIMVHRVSAITHGNANDMTATAKTLKTFDEAIAQAYVQKSGMSLEKAISLMDKETWLTANQCLELGLVDAITGTTAESDWGRLTAAAGGIRITPEMMQQAEHEMKAKEQKAQKDAKKEEITSDLWKYGI
ncbi:MAG: Clp protease ClpP [Eubacteriales bacterium]|nr:Clp protease ClpP [Eubacteriales bacterium]